jgi:hypothetical protein
MEKNPLTELEKLLYNKHNAVSRSVRNKPFKFRKTFDNIANTDKHKFLKRLSVFLRKHPEIDLDTFFEAPYKLYPDVEYFDLEYFSSMRAVKAYTTYKQLCFIQNPDSQLKSVEESLRFIAKFCIENKIQLYNYSTHRKSDVFTWMTHYKQNKINVYCMMEFPDVFSAMQSLAEDVRRFYVSDFADQFINLKLRYNASTELKPFLKKAFSTVNNFVYSQLTKQQPNVI